MLLLLLLLLNVCVEVVKCLVVREVVVVVVVSSRDVRRVLSFSIKGKMCSSICKESSSLGELQLPIARMHSQKVNISQVRR